MAEYLVTKRDFCDKPGCLASEDQRRNAVVIRFSSSNPTHPDCTGIVHTEVLLVDAIKELRKENLLKALDELEGK